jgi:hypothetical protein
VKDFIKDHLRKLGLHLRGRQLDHFCNVRDLDARERLDNTNKVLLE